MKKSKIKVEKSSGCVFNDIGIKCSREGCDICNPEDKCFNCDRFILKNMKTKNGCIWCDAEYHDKKEK